VPECLFCRIVSGDVPASRVLESPRTLSFRDVSPQAPTHVLVIPKDHYPDLAALAAADGSLLTELISQVDEVANAEGISSSGYRVVFNTGADAGQAVPHVHAHVLGGRGLGWPPGRHHADTMEVGRRAAPALRRREGIDRQIRRFCGP
jgi:histidine triad (HIT) family protein